jgi:hypothetical protein
MLDTAETTLPARFEDVAGDVSRKVHRAFSRLIGHLPGRMGRATYLQRYLEIDSKLAWQVFNVATAKDPLTAIRHIPSMISVRRVMSAAEQRGVPSEVLEQVYAAVTEFEEVGKQYANDRASFAAMVSSMHSEQADSQHLAVQQRRTAYRINCQLWGAQIGTSLTHYAIRRDENGLFSTVSINAKSSFQLLRVDTNPAVYGTSAYAEKQNGQSPPPSEFPLDPEAAAKYGSPLLPEFCSQPIPQFEKIESRSGWILHVLKTDQLGRLGAVDLVNAISYRGRQPLEMDDGSKSLYVSVRQRTPTEVSVVEFVIHRPSFGKISPKFQVVPASDGNLVLELMRPTTNFPVFEGVEDCGSLHQVVPVGDVKRYVEMVQVVYQRLGWDPSEFDVYRVTVPYPVLSTDLILWFPVER